MRAVWMFAAVVLFWVGIAPCLARPTDHGWLVFHVDGFIFFAAAAVAIFCVDYLKYERRAGER